MFFLSLLIMMILGGAELDLFTPSFPNLQSHFGLSPAYIQLLISMNFIGFFLSTFICGFLGDRYGHKKIIIYGLLVFILGSCLCTFSNDYSLIVLGRFIQGLGISAPMILSYVIISDIYSTKEQVQLMGYLNGIVTIAMAIAPVVGSYLNLYFGWRANFATLLILAIFSLIMGLLFVPASKPNPQVKLSLKSYKPIFTNRLFLKTNMALCFAIVGFWSFVGFAPLLYMNEMGVSLSHFGFYQGSVIGCFAIFSFLSPLLYKRFGHDKIFKFGAFLATFSTITLCFFSLFIADKPLVITFFMICYVVSNVAIVNILYPILLEIIPGAKGRTSSFFQAIRLLINAVGVQMIGYYYNGYFYPLGIFIAVTMIVSFILIIKLPAWKKVELADEELTYQEVH